MLLIFAALCVVLSPFFLVIERLCLFNTVPRDGYALYLLWLNGRLAGGFPSQSPYGYRLLSVALATPFFQSLPTIAPTNLPRGITADYLRATSALCAASYFCLVAACIGIWRLALEHRRDPLVAVLAATLLFVSCWYAQIVALDCVTIAAIVGGLWLLPTRRAFLAFLLSAIFINEKIIIVFALWLSLRCLLDREDRQRLVWQWMSTLAAALLYLLVVALVHLPGNSYQLTPSCFLATFRQNVVTSFSIRGAVLNGVPTLLLLCLAVIGGRGRRHGRALADILIVPGLVVVAMTLTEMLQIGRIVMHAAPLLVVAGAENLPLLIGPARSRLERRETARRTVTSTDPSAAPARS